MYGHYYTGPQAMMPEEMMQNPQMYPDHHKPKMHPITQPDYVDQSPAAYTAIHPVARIPQPNRYVTRVDPVFLDHLSKHQGLDISVQTTANEVRGKLTGVAIDHIELKTGSNRALHVRLDQIVYFEGLPMKGCGPSCCRTAPT